MTRLHVTPTAQLQLLAILHATTAPSTAAPVPATVSVDPLPVIGTRSTARDASSQSPQTFELPPIVSYVNSPVEGEVGTLGCRLSVPSKVRSVEWKKIDESSSSGYSDPITSPSVSVSVSAGLTSTNLSFESISLRDDGCYMCVFTGLSSRVSELACISVYISPKVHLSYSYSNGVYLVNCSVASRPVSTIGYEINGTAIPDSQEYILGKRFLVTRLLAVTEDGTEVTCSVNYQGSILRYNVLLMRVQEPQRVLWSLPVLGASLLTAAALLISLYTCVRRKRRSERVRPLPESERIRCLGWTYMEKAI
ncbi:CD200-like protein [Western grey kangaroopox virus]|uniref:CD200-like protein n=1 Tax=Western grey kangaroopox virus TaxID=1566307 RepID=A0A2C9DSV5_9POXV|nr:CD200-like protein [Western grey kangaroopox virus]ATI21088.1 CD200-like protein [Western grey kangaroopox virus]